VEGAGKILPAPTFRKAEVEVQSDSWTFYEAIFFDDLVKSYQNDGFVKGFRCKARKN